MTDPRIGTQVAGYEIRSLLGRGGMGVVYLAEHMHLGRLVALKLLARELGEDQGFRDRFIRESRIAAGLDHPNVVPVYDAGEAGGLLYIAMRHVPGTDLSTVLRDQGALEPGPALAILDQVAAALDAAHVGGLVHRDVKPANVLMEGDRCYLTDFGLTKRTGSSTALTASGQFVGTIDYVAPEQIQGQDVTPQTDVYALGCVLHQCLTGAPPYRRDSDIAVVYAHLEEPPPRPSERRPELPGALDGVVARALAKVPSERFSSCSELTDAARAAVAPGTAPAPTVPRPPSAAPTRPFPPIPVTAATRSIPARRRLRPPVAAAAGLVVVALLVAGMLVLGGGGGDDGDGGGEAGRGSPAAATDLQGERVEVGKEPIAVAARDGRVWVANSGSDTVSVVDAQEGQVVGEPLNVGAAPFAITVGGGVVWVANSADGTVSRLDAETGAPVGDPVPVGVAPRALALGIGNVSVWVANAGDASASRVDVATGRVLATVPVGDEPSAIATTPSSVWVANSADNTLTRIDPRRNVVDPDTTPSTGASPSGLAIKDGVMWVANSGDGTVSRLDNSDGSPVGPAVRVGGRPIAVAVGDRFVWVTDERNGTVTRIDPRRGRVVGEPIRVAGRAAGVRASGGLVWIADRSGGAVVRLTEDE